MSQSLTGRMASSRRLLARLCSLDPLRAVPHGHSISDARRCANSPNGRNLPALLLLQIRRQMDNLFLFALHDAFAVIDRHLPDYELVAQVPLWRATAGHSLNALSDARPCFGRLGLVQLLVEIFHALKPVRLEAANTGDVRKARSGLAEMDRAGFTFPRFNFTFKLSSLY